MSGSPPAALAQTNSGGPGHPGFGIFQAILAGAPRLGGVTEEASQLGNMVGLQRCGRLFPAIPSYPAPHDAYRAPEVGLSVGPDTGGLPRDRGGQLVLW